jgi:hypothetical protein
MSIWKVSLMLSVKIKHVTLSIIMLSGIMLNVLASCEHALKHQLSSSSCKESSLRNVKKSTLFYGSFSHPQFETISFS